MSSQEQSIERKHMAQRRKKEADCLAIPVFLDILNDEFEIRASGGRHDDLWLVEDLDSGSEQKSDVAC